MGSQPRVDREAEDVCCRDREACDDGSQDCGG